MSTGLFYGPFYGEKICNSILKSGDNKDKQCKNKAYYIIDNGKIMCGMHSKNMERVELPKNPDAKRFKENVIKERNELCERAAFKNREHGRKGDVICAKLRMMHEPPHVDGYLKVFPNYKHKSRPDGIGCPHLSPKSLGPIIHNQPSLPVALNLENFHQGSKVFKSELNEDGTISKKFYETQIKMFNDPEPHRHKEEAKKIKGNKNICHTWVWKIKDGREKHLSYTSCRQFYCNYYERLATKEEDFQKLKDYIDRGYNLMIIGYDGYDVRNEFDPPNTELKHQLLISYVDESRPFGHELVLLGLLTLKPEDYPWRIRKTEDF